MFREPITLSRKVLLLVVTVLLMVNCVLLGVGQCSSQGTDGCWGESTCVGEEL
jgi:hypothetical protein